MRFFTDLARVAVLALALSIPTNQKPTETMPTQQAMQCLFKSETMLGNSKICYFDCNGTVITMTIPWYQTCPLFINV